MLRLENHKSHPVQLPYLSSAIICFLAVMGHYVHRVGLVVFKSQHCSAPQWQVIKAGTGNETKRNETKRNETKRNRKPRPTMNTCIVSHCNSTIASFPGLLTPATVCRSTNAFPALVLQATNAGVRRPTYSQLAHTERPRHAQPSSLSVLSVCG